MQNYLEQIAELLEQDIVEQTDELTSFEAWDSLTQLSIIAMASDEYNVTLTNDEIIKSKTIIGLYDLIQSKM
jgi:acyl carrier protein